MDLRLVRDPLSGGAGVQCHTDLTTCCSSDQGMDRGDWYAPDSEDRLPLESEEDSLHVSVMGIRVLPCFKGKLQSVNLLVYIAVI